MHQFDALIRGLQQAASASTEAIAEQQLRLIDQFFDVLPDGARKPKMVRLQLDDQRYVMIPLASFVPPRSIGLESMRVRFSLRVEKAARERAEALARDTSGTKPLTVRLAAHDGGEQPGDRIDVIVEFQAGEAPEAVRRMLATYTDAIATVRADEPR